MTTPVSVFDSAIEKWLDNENRPWGKLKTTLTREHLLRHLPAGPLRILDVGGGTGIDSLPFAVDGHFVEIADYSASMLEVARDAVQREGLAARVTLHHAEFLELERIVAMESFDMVLCHNVIQYLDDSAAAIVLLAKTVKPGGVISLISMNRYALPWRAALIQNDLDHAYDVLDSHHEQTLVFDHAVTVHSRDEIEEMLATVGLQFEAYYGLRCLSDYWGTQEQKRQPDTWAKVARLERELARRHPYNLLARFWQIIARRPQ